MRLPEISIITIETTDKQAIRTNEREFCHDKSQILQSSSCRSSTYILILLTQNIERHGSLTLSFSSKTINLYPIQHSFSYHAASWEVQRPLDAESHITTTIIHVKWAIWYAFIPPLVCINSCSMRDGLRSDCIYLPRKLQSFGTVEYKVRSMKHLHQ